MEAKREGSKVWWAILASLFVHLVVAYSLAAFNQLAVPVPVFDDKPVELTMIDLSATPPPAAPVNPPYMETDPSKETAQEPKEKTFESNANSLAASKLPASGDAPLPTQEGKDRPFLDLATQQFSLPTEGAKAEPIPQTPASPAPTATPISTPSPKPKASEPPKPTPEPIATPEPEQFAMLTATPPPALRNPDEGEATPAPDVPDAAPPVISRPQPERPASAYQPQKQETKITGRITNRGTSAVNAVGTPLGKYKKSVSDAIGSRWYYYVQAQADLASIGTARVAAEVDTAGKITNLRILSNSANESFANICLQSFQQAQIPPIPPELIPTLPDGKLPVEFSFTFFSN